MIRDKEIKLVLLKDKKKKIIDDFKVNPKDTGSAVVQIALLTEKVNYLAEHLKIHKKRFSLSTGSSHDDRQKTPPSRLFENQRFSKISRNNY